MIERGFVWVLFLNDMRSAHYEDLRPVARATTPEELEALVERERVETYTEESGLPGTSPELPGEETAFGYRGNSQTWSKSFRKGGPLEWFNAPLMMGFGEHTNIRQVATIIDRSEEVNRIPDASTM